MELFIAVGCMLVAGAALGLFFYQRHSPAGQLRLYKGLVGELSDACLLVHNQRIVCINKPFQDLFHIPEEYLLGQDPYDVLASVEAEIPGRDEVMERVREAGYVQVTIPYTRDEREGFAEVTITSVHTVSGLALLFLRDVSSRHRTEQTLRQRDLQFRKAMEIAGLASWVYDVGANRQEWSEDLKQMLGITAEIESEYTHGSPTLKLLHPDDADVVTNMMECLRTGDDPPVTLLRFIRPDNGELRHLETHMGGLRDESGELTQILTIFQDMSDSINSQQQLRQAQKMEAIGELTGGVAHDFNNLLHVILGNAELISEPDNQRDRESLDSIMSAAKKGAELTQRLLAYSRKQVLEQRTININTCVEDMLPLLERTLGESVEIETDLCDDLKNCHIDLGNLENSILNLVVNAQFAMPEGGKLRLATENILLEPADIARNGMEDLEPGHYIQLVVTDSGVGIPADVLKRVFEPFFTTKEVGKGSGLGLSMVFGFIKQSRGHVVIESLEGEGTSVRLLLPTSDEELPDVDIVEVPGELEFKGRVLLVEDDVEVANLTSAFLAIAGFDVRVAENAEQAFEQMDTNPDFTLLLSDVVLPGGINGAQVAREFHQRFPGARVIFMSGYTENAIIDQGVIDEDFVLLSKPFTRADLMEKILDAIEAEDSNV